MSQEVLPWELKHSIPRERTMSTTEMINMVWVLAMRAMVKRLEKNYQANFINYMGSQNLGQNT